MDKTPRICIQLPPITDPTRPDDVVADIFIDIDDFTSGSYYTLIPSCFKYAVHRKSQKSVWADMDCAVFPKLCKFSSQKGG
jgi:hypothetical protein